MKLLRFKVYRVVFLPTFVTLYGDNFFNCFRYTLVSYHLCSCNGSDLSGGSLRKTCDKPSLSAHSKNSRKLPYFNTFFSTWSTKIPAFHSSLFPFTLQHLLSMCQSDFSILSSQHPCNFMHAFFFVEPPRFNLCAV